MKLQFNPKNSFLIVMIVLAGMWRLLFTSGHSPLGNFTPIGAMALFGGCYFTDRIKSYLVPLLTLWLSDIFLNYIFYFHEWKLFYDGFLFTYGSFALMVLIGKFIKKVSVKNVIIAGVSAALLHWVITNFGVWVDRRMYPLTSEGLTACYIAGIPYLKNLLVGNLVFSGIMFGAFELMQKRYTVLSVQN